MRDEHPPQMSSGAQHRSAARASADGGGWPSSAVSGKASASRRVFAAAGPCGARSGKSVARVRARRRVDGYSIAALSTAGRRWLLGTVLVVLGLCPTTAAQGARVDAQAADAGVSVSVDAALTDGGADAPVDEGPDCKFQCGPSFGMVILSIAATRRRREPAKPQNP